MVNINVNINICYIRWTTYYGLYKLYILRLMYGEYSPIMVDIFRARWCPDTLSVSQDQSNLWRRWCSEVPDTDSFRGWNSRRFQRKDGLDSRNSIEIQLKKCILKCDVQHGMFSSRYDFYITTRYHKNHFWSNLVVRVLNSVHVTGKRDWRLWPAVLQIRLPTQNSRVLSVFQTNSFQLGFINHGTIDTSHSTNCCLEHEEPFKHGQTCYGRNTMFCQVKHSISTIC